MTIRIVHWVCRLILAGIFIYGGYVKVKAPLEFAAAIMAYQLVPAKAVYPLAEYLPWVEIALGAVLLSGWKIRYTSIAAAALLCSFIVVLTVTYLRGIEADCGCFGSGDRISPLTIARDALFLLPGAFLAWEHKFRARQNAFSAPQAS
jgi:putative oxidoreductase